MNNEPPLVSVIIPSYNCGKYIDEAVSGVLNQTYPNVEVIVIDDGSTDNTLDILSKYRNEIKVISQPNQGVAKARNTGISAAAGKYIATLDADDRWLEKPSLPGWLFIFRNIFGRRNREYCIYKSRITACNRQKHEHSSLNSYIII